MSVHCIDPERIGDVLARPERDPERAHVAGCPRCSALADEYRLFLDTDVPSAGADPIDAERRLTAALAGAIGVSAPARRAVPEPRESWIRRLMHPALRPAWGFAAVAAVLAVVVAWPRLATTPTGVLRGDRPAASHSLELLGAQRGTDGVRLSWRSWPSAERYQARFFSSDLREIGRSAETSDTSLFVPLGSLPFPSASSESVFVRVVALSGGDAVASSPARALAER